MDQLNDLWEREGRPGVDALYIATKRSESGALRGLTKKRIKESIQKLTQKAGIERPSTQ